VKKLISILVILFAWIAVQSHEFWMQPKKFKYNVGEEMRVDFLVGENFEGEAWDLKKNKIEQINLHHPTKSIDLKILVKPEEKDKLKFKFTEAGTHLISMQSDESISELDAQKFNDYLKEDGLDDILDLRTKTNSLDKPCKELYSRYAKVLIQCGDRLDDTFKKKTNLRLEIIPLQNPYSLKSGDYLQCLLLFNGKPCPHQQVKIWNKIGNASIAQNAFSENDGTIKFPISSKGPWMISTVKMIPSEKPGADWQSFWGSLVFGIE
jgi:uncharacterized GH25 family protein